MRLLVVCLLGLVTAVNGFISCSETAYELTTAHRATILSVFNTARSNIANGTQRDGGGRIMGPSSNMRLMWYNCEHEKEAMRQALIHKNHIHMPPGTVAPEDIFNDNENSQSFAMTSGPDQLFFTQRMAEIMLDWAVGVSWTSNIYNKSVLPPMKYMEGGRNIIHAEADQVGCARVLTKDGTSTGQLLVCHFSNGGPRDGEPFFEVGPVCSNCGEGYKCNKKTNLCVANDWVDWETFVQTGYLPSVMTKL